MSGEGVSLLELTFKVTGFAFVGRFPECSVLGAPSHSSAGPARVQ